MQEIEGKNRLRVDYVDGFGQQRSQVYVDVDQVKVAESMVFVMVDEGGGKQSVVFGVPVTRLVRFARLKDSEQKEDHDGEEEGQAGESTEDSQVRNDSEPSNGGSDRFPKLQRGSGRSPRFSPRR